MPTNAEFLTAIDDWTNKADEASVAGQARNYRRFQRAFRSGTKCFQIIRDGIRQNLHDSLSEEQRNLLEQAARRWDALRVDMTKWKNEVHNQFQQRHRATTRGKKISKGYGLTRNKPGQNLRLKAT